MRRIALLATSAVFFLTLHAQKTPKEKLPSAWKTGGMFTLLAGQTGMRNWAPTGSEKLVLTASGSMNLWATKKWGKNTWSNTADLNYGLVYTHSTDTRKIDDKIDIYSIYGFGIKPLVSIGVLASLRTQFTNGYDYTESPRKRISGFFAPAYIAAGPGVQLKTKNDAFG